MFVKLETVKEIASTIIAENQSAISRELTDWEKTLIEVSVHKAIHKIQFDSLPANVGSTL